MKKTFAIVLVVTVAICSCSLTGSTKISLAELKDKIAGGWAGKMIGVSYGAPTEFRAQNKIYEKELSWSTEQINNSLQQDDLYVQMSFMMTMDEYGINAPAEKFSESFAKAGYPLWHANVQGRKNFFDGIMPPASGNPKYNMHADDIDFQIEADYIGFMCPGMPQTSNAICDKIGHIMNYGDGVYGGMFVCALYTTAFFEKDIEKVVATALKSIPEQSQYAQCIRDVIAGHKNNPDDWQATWQGIQDKWGNVDICGAMSDFNIDAKLNGAYIVMGLLYGGGDFAKTMEVTIRCGQDSDCNPSNAAAVLGIRDGYNSIPEKWRHGIPAIADSVFIFTKYSFNSVVESTLAYAQKLIVQNGGRIQGDAVYINLQSPAAPPLEESFPGLRAVSRATVGEGNGWFWKGYWQEAKDGNGKLYQKVAQAKDSEVTFAFIGAGALLMGRWDRSGGKANVYVDGRLDRSIDTYYWLESFGEDGGWVDDANLYHVLGLPAGQHTIRLVLTGAKRAESLGSKICIKRAIVFEAK